MIMISFFKVLFMADLVITFVGPVVAEATFVNREETPVYPIYRDPVSHFNGS